MHHSLKSRISYYLFCAICTNKGELSSPNTNVFLALPKEKEKKRKTFQTLVWYGKKCQTNEKASNHQVSATSLHKPL